MDLTEVVQIAITIILTLGGVGFIFWKVSDRVGEYWANKHLESIKNENIKEIELIKQENEKEIEDFKHKLDLLNESQTRYSGEQFKLYTSLYHTLYDLKLKGDFLWDCATSKRLTDFRSQLKDTKSEVEKSYLFLETTHYEKFIEIFDHFIEYQRGKESILELKISKDNHIIDSPQFQNWIERNKIQKDEYSRLVDEIRNDLRDQLRGKQ